MNFYTDSINPDWNRRVFLCLNKDITSRTEISECECCKLIYIKSGSAEIVSGEKRTKLFSPALVAASHIAKAEISGSFSVDVLGFLPEVINDRLSCALMLSDNLQESLTRTEYQDAVLLRFFYDNPVPFSKQLSPEEAAALSALLFSLDSELTNQAGGYWPCRSRSFFLQLLFTVNNIFSADEAPEISAEKRLVMNVVSYMSRRIGEKITVADISKEFGVNRNRISAAFIAETGKPTIKYLIEMRLALGASMLRETEVPIGEIAERVGFSDIVGFGRSFKEKYGMSPSDYRKAAP